MNIDINIETLVADAVAAALAPERMQPIIESKLEEVVKRAIESQFSYRGDFQTMLEQKLSEVMPTDFEGVARYGDLVSKTVNSMLIEYQHQAVNQTIKEKIEAMVKALPARMKLSELIAKLTKSFDSRSQRNGSDQPTVLITKSTGTCDGYWRLDMDPENDIGQYSCKIQMAFTNEGECYSLKIDDRDPSKSLFLGAAFGAEALVLNIYTGGVKVDFEDINTDDIYYANSDYD